YASRRRHTRTKRDWSSDVCSSDLLLVVVAAAEEAHDLALPGVGGLPVPQLGFEIWGRGGDQGVDAFGQRAVGGFHPFDLGQKVVFLPGRLVAAATVPGCFLQLCGTFLHGLAFGGGEPARAFGVHRFTSSTTVRGPGTACSQQSRRHRHSAVTGLDHLHRVGGPGLLCRGQETGLARTPGPWSRWLSDTVCFQAPSALGAPMPGSICTGPDADGRTSKSKIAVGR